VLKQKPLPRMGGRALAGKASRRLPLFLLLVGNGVERFFMLVETFTALEWEAEQERRRRGATAAPRRDGDGRIEATCAHPGCTRFEPDPATGLVAMLPVKRWWCPEHRSGREDDLQPWTPGYRFSEIGLIVDDDDLAEAEREGRRSEHEAPAPAPRGTAGRAPRSRR
jgi:hypothetical protein